MIVKLLIATLAGGLVGLLIGFVIGGAVHAGRPAQLMGARGKPVTEIGGPSMAIMGPVLGMLAGALLGLSWVMKSGPK